MTPAELKRSFNEFAEQVAKLRPRWASDPAEYLSGADGTWQESPSWHEYMAAVHDLPKASRDVQGRGTLVVSVGTSFQPVLLSIALHQPKHLVLAGSYDQRSWFPELARFAARLVPELQVEAAEPFDKANAVEAWHSITRALQGLPRPFVIDITGGTKAMSAVAFYLSIELEISAVYLRSEFVGSAGAPEPCSARMVELDNPGLALALHDLRRVEGLWNRRAFAAAAHLLEEITPRFDGLDDRRYDAVADATIRAQRLAAWSAADYGALREWSGLPSFLRDLLPTWPPEPGDAERWLTADCDRLLRHLVSAWVWLEAPSTLDPAVRFLRAFALGEWSLEGVYEHLCRQERVALTGNKPVQADVDDNDPIVVSVRTGRWTAPGFALAKLLGGSAKSRREVGIDLVDFEKMQAASPWYKGPPDGRGPWRDARNRCAHGIGTIRQEHMEGILSDVWALFTECAARIGLPAEALVSWRDDARRAIPPFDRSTIVSG